MLIETNFEFRGASCVTSKDGTKSYVYLNVEDSDGESAKFLSSLPYEEVKNLERGEHYQFSLDYSTKYGSLRIVGVE